MPDSADSSVLRGGIAAVATFAFTYLTLSWLVQFRASAEYDWVVFQDTARRFLAGRYTEIYPGVPEPFLFPPSLVPLLAPLGWLSRLAGYSAIVAALALSTAGSLWILRRLVPGARGETLAFAVLVLSSASWHVMIRIGHLSALFLLVVLAAVHAAARKRDLLAGALLALAMLKPNLGLLFPALLLARGRWRMLAGWGIGVLLLVSAALPMGASIWPAYFESQRVLLHLLTERIEMWKQQTIFAFWRTVLGEGRATLALAMWIVTCAPLAWLAIRAWRRTAWTPAAMPRLFGLAILLLVACTPYLYLYDGLLLALPAAVVCFDGDGWASPARRRVCAAAAFFVYSWQHLATWILKGGWALVGPVVGVWLAVAAWDLLSSARYPRRVSKLGAAPRDPTPEKHPSNLNRVMPA